MWGNVFKVGLKVAAATALFGAAHSLLAGFRAKRGAAALLGERGANALYRPFYNAQSIVAFAALALYVSRLPDRELYRARGAGALALRAAQAGAIVYLLAAANQIGVLRFAGLASLGRWLMGEQFVPPAPEAQGPALDHDGRLRAGGPFRAHRHPMNFAFCWLLWLNPRMTANLAAFNLSTTVYAVLGSRREERRLLARYGAAHAEYLQSGAPFFLPDPRRLLGRRTGTGAMSQTSAEN